MQVGAMQGRIGRTVLLGRDRLQWYAMAQAGIVPFDRHLVGRLEGNLVVGIPQAESADHLHAVWPDLEPGADLLERRGAFIDVDRETALMQRDRGGQPADAATDNGNAEWPATSN